MQEGWIKIRRSILGWEWWDKPEMVVLYLYILSSANIEDTLWHGKVIKRGQFVTSLSSIERDCPKLTKKIIRTCLKRFKDAGKICIDSTNNHSVITVCEYEEYNCTDNVLSPQTEEKAQAENNLEIPPTQLEKKQSTQKKSQEEIKQATEKRAKDFYNSLIPFVATYGKEMVREFYDYWSEPNKSQSRLRFEQERTWDLNRRLARWSNHAKEYKSNDEKKNRSNNDFTAIRVGEAADLVDSLLSAQS